MAWCRLREGGPAFRLDRIHAAALTEKRAPDRDLPDVAANIMEWVRSLSPDL